MRMTITVLAAVALATACGGGAPAPEPPAPPAAPAMAYAMPASETLVYEQADSGGFSMEVSGMGTVDVQVVGRATAQLDFQPVGDSLRVTVTLTELSGRFMNSMGPTVMVGNEHRPTAATLTVTPSGEVRIDEEPEFPRPLAQVFTPQMLYKGFFIRLPGRDIEQGTSWTDTVRIVDTSEGMTVTTTSVVTSVWSRDTTLNDRTLRVIESQLQNTIDVSGTTQDVEIRQHLEGTSEAVSLWDPEARVLVERTESGEASGTTDLPGMGMTGMPVTAHTHQRLRLVQ